MPRKKREDGQPVERSLKMPAWLSAEVETISEISGMTQAKVTAILAALVFPETLAAELRQRVYVQLGALLLPGQVRVGHENIQIGQQPQAAPGGLTAYQIEQANLFGIDPADVVIPDAAPPPDPELLSALQAGLPVGDGPDDPDPY